MPTFRIQYYTHWGEELHIDFGCHTYLMDNDGLGNWFVHIPNNEIKDCAEYSYFVTENGTITRREWKGHRLDNEEGKATIHDWWKDRPAAPFNSPRFAHIVGADKVCQWRGSGVAIPVFSLRSYKSFGIGEFTDIPLLVDWAARTGMSVIQLLPVNDTTMTRTWTDSYPYNTNSTFALQPAYINLECVGRLKSRTVQQRFSNLQQELNSLPQVDFERVSQAKWEYLRLIYAEKGTETFSSPAFHDFFLANAYWLRPYAVFCHLRDAFGTPDFTHWTGFPYTEALIESYAPSCEQLLQLPLRSKAKRKDEFSDIHTSVAFHYFIQYHLHLQLKQASDYAHDHGIALKGDIPIGISRTSVDAWAYPQLFHMNSQAGAPPDAFAVDGQNWGFPTYDWEEMAKDNYSWFRRRFQKMSDYFDAYRIDHLLGFFRIWEIPVRYTSGLLGHFNPALPYSEGDICSRLWIDHDMLIALSNLSDDFRSVSSLRNETDVLFVQDEYHQGYFHPRIFGFDAPCFAQLNDEQKKAYQALHEEFFYHRHNDFWRGEAMKKLPLLIDSTDMLVCGEDLGMIPTCVPDVMRELHILSLEIQQMPKTFGVAFGLPSQYPYNSVCTTSSHDMANIRAWWEENMEVTENYWRTMLHRTDDVPSVCPPTIMEEIIQDHVTSPSMLTILPMQDWLGMDEKLRYPDPAAERINIPANPRHYWRYRIHFYLEELLMEDNFNDNVKRLAQRNLSN